MRISAVSARARIGEAGICMQNRSRRELKTTFLTAAYGGKDRDAVSAGGNGGELGMSTVEKDNRRLLRRNSRNLEKRRNIRGTLKIEYGVGRPQSPQGRKYPQLNLLAPFRFRHCTSSSI